MLIVNAHQLGMLEEKKGRREVQGLIQNLSLNPEATIQAFTKNQNSN
jgi:hypothetical protein